MDGRGHTNTNLTSESIFLTLSFDLGFAGVYMTKIQLTSEHVAVIALKYILALSAMSSIHNERPACIWSKLAETTCASFSTWPRHMDTGMTTFMLHLPPLYSQKGIELSRCTRCGPLKLSLYSNLAFGSSANAPYMHKMHKTRARTAVADILGTGKRRIVSLISNPFLQTAFSWLDKNKAAHAHWFSECGPSRPDPVFRSRTWLRGVLPPIGELPVADA